MYIRKCKITVHPIMNECQLIIMPKRNYFQKEDLLEMPCGIRRYPRRFLEVSSDKIGDRDADHAADDFSDGTSDRTDADRDQRSSYY